MNKSDRHVKGLGEVSICVRDLDAMHKFYEEVVGLEVLRRDVIKALALGAKMVLVGRPVLWGLAVDGEAGSCAVLELLRREFDTALALVGCPRAADLNRDFVTRL